MTVNEYQALAMRTLNPELTKRDVLINSVMGLCGESGEAIDIVKKWMAHGHELDKAHQTHKGLRYIFGIFHRNLFQSSSFWIHNDFHFVSIHLT